MRARRQVNHALPIGLGFGYLTQLAMGQPAIVERPGAARIVSHNDGQMGDRRGELAVLIRQCAQPIVAARVLRRRLVKKLTVMGIMGKTQGVNKASPPEINASQR